MIERTTITNEYGVFTIQNIDGNYSVFGNRGAAKHEFKKIHRMPPNEYGNFYGREKAGFEACKEIINKKYGQNESNKMFKYYTRFSSTGDLIEEFNTKEEAKKAIEAYEAEDIKNGEYTEDYYEVVSNID